MSIIDAFYRVSDRAHFLGSFSVILLPAFLFGPKIGYFLGLPLLIWAAWKEFYWDLHHEDKAERGGTGWKSGVRDFKGYLYGTMASESFIYLKPWVIQYANTLIYYLKCLVAIIRVCW